MAVTAAAVLLAIPRSPTYKIAIGLPPLLLAGIGAVVGLLCGHRLPVLTSAIGALIGELVLAPVAESWASQFPPQATPLALVVGYLESGLIGGVLGCLVGILLVLRRRGR